MDFITNLENCDSMPGLFRSYFAKGDIKHLLEYEQRIKSLSVTELEDMKKYFDKNITVILKNK